MIKLKVCARPVCKRLFYDPEPFITCPDCRSYLHPEECRMNNMYGYNRLSGTAIVDQKGTRHFRKDTGFINKDQYNGGGIGSFNS